MDRPWAQAGWYHPELPRTSIFKHLSRSGDGFALIDLPAPLGRTGLGICMDLNPMAPLPFTPTTIPYEFADFALENSCRTLVLLCNWLDPGTKPEIEWSIDTVNYWAERLFPLWDDSGANDALSSSREGDDGTLVIICNRTGVELGQYRVFDCRSENVVLKIALCRHHVCGHLDRDEDEPFVGPTRSIGCYEED
jgi:hypothetical protein